ncbi:Fis family transcriptional regulator [Neisseriaceae bacterium PsAf]|nr:Fis family transcriptional regulator [Neisseriaceae bacterium PsAf]
MTEQKKCITIGQCIQDNMIIYFDELEGEEPTGVYDMVISQVEKSLIDFILEKCNGNQTKTAKMLGISRNSLRVRIEKHNLNMKG